RGEIFSLIQTYQSLTQPPQGLPPSGADIIAQLTGGLCYFHPEKKLVETYIWPFPELELFLIRTGHKIPTHEHLETLTNIPKNELAAITLQGLQAIESQNSDDFIKAINNYAMCLQQLNFVAATTQTLLKKLPSVVLAAKGCGALGADVVLAITMKNE